MSKITRRGFIASLAASGAMIAARPALAYVEKVDNFFEIKEKKIILNKPLVLDRLNNFKIKTCHISPSDNFEGESLVVIRYCDDGVLTDCILDGRNIVKIGLRHVYENKPI